VITSLEVQDFKRVQLVRYEPAATGLTIIGGRNGQGKTSSLDAAKMLFGGERFTPTSPIREGADKAALTGKLSNGLLVEVSITPRGAYYKITDPEGKKAGITLLKETVNELALDLSRFMAATDKDKAKTLLKIVGVDLTPFEERHAKLYKEREDAGRLRDRSKHHAEAMPYNEACGSELLTPSDIMAELEAKVGKNAKNREIRQKVDIHRANIKAASFSRMQSDLAAATAAATAVQDEDVTALKERLAQIEDTNAEVRKNLEREKALAEAEGYADEWRALSGQIETNQAEMRALLDGAAMPLSGLSVAAGGVLTYNGKAWDCMGDSERLQVATSIVRKINPACGFVLLDGLERMDLDTLREFGAWLQAEGLQVLGTKVSSGPECSLIIEDGLVQDAEVSFG
jgi:DNA repair exonuclease SbcCD ATPase subunit